MIIQGARYWNDADRLHVQENNSFEILVPGLEYCGPTAAANCIEALYEDVAPWCVIQLEDYLTAFFLDRGNIPMFNNIRPLPYGLGAGQWPPNEIPQLYPYAVRRCFNVESEYREHGTFEDVAKEVLSGNAVQLCIPGHFIAALAYDSQTGQIGFKDSWVGDRWPGGSSIQDALGNKWFSKDHFDVVNKWYIVYRKPGGS
jgi:hypothetical protein